MLEDGKKQGETLENIMIAKANQDIKREIMNASERIIDECFTKAHHKLSTLKETEYTLMVTKLVEDGCKKIGGPCKLEISRDLDKKIAEKMNLKIIGQVETAGGIILHSEDGNVTLDHTFDGILRRERNRIRIKVGKMLFQE